MFVYGTVHKRVTVSISSFICFSIAYDLANDEEIAQYA